MWRPYWHSKNYIMDTSNIYYVQWGKAENHMTMSIEGSYWYNEKYLVHTSNNNKKYKNRQYSLEK